MKSWKVNKFLLQIMNYMQWSTFYSPSLIVFYLHRKHENMPGSTWLHALIVFVVELITILQERRNQFALLARYWGAYATFRATSVAAERIFNRLD